MSKKDAKPAAEEPWDQASDPRPPSQVEAEAPARDPQPDESADEPAGEESDG